MSSGAGADLKQAGSETLLKRLKSVHLVMVPTGYPVWRNILWQQYFFLCT